MSHPPVSRMVEDYLTLIWKAYEWPDSSPSTGDLAASLGVTAPTVSANLKKLSRDGFIDYEPYGSFSLTAAGREIAIDIVRRHRIIETYLVERLRLSWDQVHDEADRLEHAVSDLVLDRMDDELGHPTTDPHGDPIPSKTGEIRVVPSVPLSAVGAGRVVRVVRVSDRQPEILRYLEAKRIDIGATLTVTRALTAAGAMTVDTADGTVELSSAAASDVRVS